MIFVAMATPPPLTAAQRWAYAQRIEAQIQSLQDQENPTFEQYDHLITGYRMACEATLLTDFEFAFSTGVGRHLWDAHILINKRYRKLLDRYKKGELKKHVVDRRKLEKHYVDFIKTSQFFYKGYIQRLASHFDGLNGLRRIAHCLQLETLTVDEREKVSPNVAQLIEKSCHATLLRLGDLSRYRNELRTRDRSWEPALGYYRLANDLRPDNGTAYNQMAVVAVADENHLEAVYCMYRSLTTKQPHTLGKANLELEFKKVKSAWDKKRGQPKTDSLSTLVWWFILLHAKFYDGVDFSTHDELENEVLSRMTLLLKEQSFGETLEKFVIINIAAEDFARQRIRQEGNNILYAPELLQSWYFTTGFNIRMMFVLLQVLLPELEDAVSAEEIPVADVSQAPKPKEKISAIARRVLPALRQYSIWLTARAELIMSMVSGNRSIGIHSKELWKMYAIVLTRLTNFFPVIELPSVNYLLEEDESTVGFKPFRELEIPEGSIVPDLYTDDDGANLKARITDPGVGRNHPNIEMQARIKDIIVCGLGLQLRSSVPITLDQNGPEGPMFTFVEDSVPFTSPISSPVKTPSATSSQRTSQSQARVPPRTFSSRASTSMVAGPSSRQSTDPDMHRMDDMSRMVDELVEPPSASNPANETSYDMHSFTANEVFAHLETNGFDSRYQVQGTPKLLPSLPGFHNSAFKPKPNELQHPTSPRRPNTSQHVSPIALSTEEQRLAAARDLDRLTGFSSLSHTSRSRGGSQQLPNPLSRSSVINDVQASLSQQFMIPQSSNFSDFSGVDASTPRRVPGFSNNNLFRPRPSFGGNDSTMYGAPSDYDKFTMLASPVYKGSQPARGNFVNTPPSNQEQHKR